jgi:uncharacterized repeat protein (TIGR01451 family)
MVMAGPTITATKSHTGGPFHLGDTITYSTTISNTGTGDATGVEFMDTPDPNTTLVGGSLMASPVTVDDAYTCTGNLSIAIAAPGVFGNDFKGLNPAVTSISAFDATSVNGGTVTMTTTGASVGAFTYQPAAGFRGTDTFTYTLTNSVGSSVGKVTITVSNMVWFINNAAGSAGDGRFASPFNTLAAFQAVNDGVGNHPHAGDAIFIYQGSGNYTGPLTLLANQRLTGQGDALNSTTLGFTPDPNTNITLPGATAKPTLTGTLTLASNVTALAVDLNTGANTGLTGSSLTGVTVGDVPPTTTNGFTVTTTTGTAVNLNTVGGTFTFRSISANGAVNGIKLTTTTGSFDVEGDGASDVTNTTRGRTTVKSGGGTLTLGSGGTIQNTTGTNASGILLSSAANVTLRNMVIQNNGGNGLKNGNDGMTVTNGSTLILDNTVISGTAGGGQSGNNGLHATGLAGLTIEHCEIHDNATQSGVAGGTAAWNVRLDEVTGTVAVDNSKLQNSFDRVMGTQNHTTTTVTLNVTNSLFDGGASNNGSALLAEAFDTASLTLSFTGGTANNGRNGEGVDANYNNSSTGSFTVKNSTFDNNGILNGGGADIAVASQKGNVTADIESNTTRMNTTIPAGGGSGTSISADVGGVANPTSLLQAKILNNTVGNAAVGKSASTNGAGIAVQGNAGIMTVNFSGNTVNQSGSEGIVVLASGTGSGASPTATINATVTGNTATVTNNVNAADALNITAGGGGFADTVCANISGNVKFDASNNANALGGITVESLGGATLNLQGYSGAANNVAQLTTFLNGTTTTVNPAPNVVPAGGTIQAASSACSTPSFASIIAPVKAQTAHKGKDIASQGPNQPEVPGLTDGELPPLVAAALYRWQTAGISSKDLERLRSITFRVSDLAKPHLSEMPGDNEVLLDRTAAGYGWFVDSNAYNDLQFDQQISACTAIASELSPAYSRIDLLSVIVQAFGVVLDQDNPHEAGALERVDDENKSPELRRREKLFELTQVSLTPGTRRVPDNLTIGPRQVGMGAQSSDAATGIAASKPTVPARTRRNRGGLTPQAAPVDVVVGTLNPGKSVIIKFQVTVNNPLTSPSTAVSVSNTGQVNGTNFTTVNSNTDTAVLCVPTTISTALTNQQVAAGTTATFSTTLTGTAPFTFVWKKNGTTLVSGVSLGGRATINTTSTTNTSTSTLTITGTVTSDSDTYTVDGTNACSDTPATHQSATLTVVSPPTVAKSFNPTTIPLNGVTTLTLTLTNPNASTTLTGVNFSDNMTGGLQVANPAGIGSTCTGTWNATPGDTTLNFGGGTMPPGTSCTLTVKITSTSAGIKPNATNAPQSNEGGTGVASNTANLTVVGPPTIQKSFAASTVPLNGTVNLNFTITNPNTFTGGDLTGIAFTDSLPAGLTVATSGPTTTCGGTLTTTNPSTITFTAGALAHGATPTTCTFSVPVTGSTVGVKNNTTTAITSNEGGTGATSNTATVTVLAPPTISKAFGATNIAVGGTTSLSFTVTNPNTTVALTGVGFTDTLPGGLTVATSGPSPQCSGTLTTANPSTITLAGATIAASGTCTFSVNVTGATAGMKNNTTGAVTSTNGGTGTTSNTATVTVASPPTINKAFGNASILVGATTSLTFSISNPNSGLGLTGISFTDTLPAGLSVPTASTTTCGGGTLTTTLGAPSTISFSGGTLAASANCSFSVTVTGTAAGVLSNTTSAISSTESGTGATSNTAMITVIGAPTISKAFSAATICTGGVATLTFTITNPNTTTAFTGIAFNDTLPSGLVVASPANATPGCSGTFTPNPGDTTLTFTGGSLAANSNCTVKVDVTGTTVGTKNNTSGTVSSTEGGTGGTSNQATITVVAPPVAVADTFATQKNTPLNQPAPGVLANDTLNGASIFSYGATTGGEQTTIGASTATSGGGTVSLNANGSFSYTPAAGFTGMDTFKYVLKSPGGCTSTATVTISVAAAPTISKAFGLASIPVGGTTSLTFSITNPNTSQSLSGITFTDMLPGGLSVPSGTVATCGGTLTTIAPGMISFTGGTLAGSGTCSFMVTVMGTAAGVQNNTTSVISSNESGAGATSNTATVTVVGPATISKAFSVATIPLSGGTATLTFTITNNNTTTTLTGVGFTDTLPAGLVVASTPNASTSCGGTFAPNAGDTSLTFSGGSIAPSGTCTIKVDVTGTTAGVKNNTSSGVTSNEGGTGTASNTATITVLAPPTITKSFGAPNIPIGGTTSLSFTISNPNSTVALTGVGFTDTLPTGLTVANGSSTPCGGSLTTTNPSTITLTGATIAASGTCTFSVIVTGTTAGVKNNTTGAVMSTNGGTGTTSNTATVTVASAPTITKGFAATSILLGQTTTLSFTITNTNATLGLTGVSFTDALPAGLTVANGTSTTCGGGTLMTTSPGTITLTGGTIAAGGMCSMSVTVTGSTTGVWNNTTQAVSSTESGPGTVSNTAPLTVVGPPTIAKSFDAATIPLNGTSVLTFTITNPNTTTAFTGVAFTDMLPAGLTVPNGSSTVCGGGTVTTTAPNMISLSGGAIGTSTNCIFTVTVTGTTAGVKNNTTGTVSATNGGTGGTSNTATITVLAPPTISKAFGAPNIPLGGTTSLSFTITNPNSTVALTGVGFTDTLPGGLTVATSGPTSQCGGSLTTANPSTITLSGATVAAGGTCTFSVTVTGATGGVKNNTTGAVTSTNGGTGTVSNTATLTVATPPTISKSFGAATVPLGGTTTLTFTITNTNATLGITGVMFTDPLPSGLTVANGSSATCGGGTLTTSGGNMIALTGGSIAAGGSCTMSVTVTGATAGVKNNTSGAVSATETGTGTTSNTATLTVLAPPTIAKSFGAATVPLNQTTTLTFTLTNPNATVALTGVGFTDTLPAGLTAVNGSSSQCGGTLAITGNNTITLTGATLPLGGGCTFSVTVTGATAGVKNNTTGAITSANGGTGTTSNTATITVVAPPTITKAFGATFVPVGQTTTLTFTLTNPNPTVALTGVGFTDTFPAGLVVANPASATDGCGGTFAPNPGDTSLTFSGGTIAMASSCVISVKVQVTSAGTKTNTTSTITSANGGTGGTSNTVTLVTFDKCLRDDSTGNFIQFSSMTGDYRFVQCSGGSTTLTGTGTVTINGNVLTLQDFKTDRRISISFFTNTNTGHAALSIQVAQGVWQSFTINDTNPNAVCACGP